MKAFGDTFQFL